MANRKRVPETERFMSHVAKAESGCWLWTAFKMPSGYGNFRTSDGHRLAHRAAYRIFCGELVDGMDVMHSCDNPSCVNPEHLSLGSRTDNMRDAKSKGRNAKGEKHGRSKLSVDQVIAIRQMNGPQSAIAKQFDISQPTVSDIKTRRKWAHI